MKVIIKGHLGTGGKKDFAEDGVGGADLVEELLISRETAKKIRSRDYDLPDADVKIESDALLKLLEEQLARKASKTTLPALVELADRLKDGIVTC